jgi:superfamily II DNA or RNA helicase
MIIDQNRLARQNLAINKFIGHIESGHRGAVLEMPTGFGKTYLAFLSIKRFKNLDKIIHIVVPTIVLKEQWEKSIREELPEYKNIEVFVINTYVSIPRFCSYLIIDENHRAANEDAIVFIKVIDNCTFEYLLGLSAKFTNLQLEFLESKGVKLIDRITVEEAKRNKWVSNYKIYNLSVRLTDE